VYGSWQAAGCVIVCAPMHEDRVRAYYRRNMPFFSLFGGSKGPLPVHRRIWAPGISNARDALLFTDRRIIAEAADAASCLDLGCGEGATLLELAGHGIRRCAGITLSGLQARNARRHFRSRSIGIPIVLGSYLDAAAYPALPPPRLLFAIESMVHARSAVEFLAATARYAEQGDRLIVVDDFLASDSDTSPASGDMPLRRRRLVRGAREGWRAPSLMSARGFTAMAGKTGWSLLRGEDWSPWVSAGSRRTECAARAVMSLALLLVPPLAGNLVGGSALLLGYRLGVFSYRFMVFRRR
jgi:hypothetical protein